MPSAPFSAQTLGLVAQLLPEYFTHTGLDTVFLTSGLTEPAESSGVSKARRVLNVLQQLRSDTDAGHAEAALIAIVTELLGRVTSNGSFASSRLDPAEANLLRSLSNDGWEHDGSLLRRKGAPTSLTAASELRAAGTVAEAEPIDLSTSKRVFIVHGRDPGAKSTVARFVERLGFTAVVLHEQASSGRTVLEKFLAEASDAAFALVLLTPDDHGGLAGGPTQARARQNVVLEFGYFVGLLGRGRVAALVSDGVELPSDLAGLVYVPFDASADEWKLLVAREMRAAGLRIDLNGI